jgi:TatD DNase family protein
VFDSEKMLLVDTHAHLDNEHLYKDLKGVVGRAQLAGVEKIISIGAGDGSLSAERAVEIAKSYTQIWATVGIHPHDADSDYNFSIIEELAVNPKVVGIGETGLDLFKEWAPFDKQLVVFVKQIELAIKVNKPLIIHSRNAGKECLSILKKLNAERVGGVFHCYSESFSFYEQLRQLNFYVSFPGIITFKNASAMREVVKMIPLSHILVETDSPYLAPEPHRGKVCESSYIEIIVKKIAELKNIDFNDCAEQLLKNTYKLFPSLKLD